MIHRIVLMLLVSTSLLYALNGSSSSYSVGAFATTLQGGYGTSDNYSMQELIDTMPTANANSTSYSVRIGFFRSLYPIAQMTIIVTLNSPLDQSYLNTSNISFNFTPSSSVSPIPSCDIYLDGILNQSVSSLQANVSSIITINNIPDGLHEWYVECISNASGTWNFTLDTIPPLIQFVNPTDTNGTYINRTYIVMNTTASDANLSNMTVFVYNQLYGLVNSSTSNSSPFYIDLGIPGSGLYHFLATVYDAFGNSNSTEMRDIFVLGNQTSIIIMPSAPPVSAPSIPASAAPLNAVSSYLPWIGTVMFVFLFSCMAIYGWLRRKVDDLEG